MDTNSNSQRPSIPNFLLFSDLLVPIDNAMRLIKEAKEEVENASSAVIQKSLFSYIVSLHEIIQSDLLTIILNAFPQKLSSKSLSFEKEDLLYDINQVKKRIIEEHIRNLAYKNINDYMEEFFKILSIPPMDNDDLKNSLIEIKETRNLLLHNNLKMNSTYKAKAGLCKRREDRSGYLPLPKTYIISSITVIVSFIDYVKKALTKKYSNYDKYFVLETIWNYLFQSPVLQFNDLWEKSSWGVSFKGTPRKLKANVKSSYSSSENTLLFLWFSHFNRTLCNKVFTADYANTFNLHDDFVKERYLFLTQTIINYPDIFK